MMYGLVYNTANHAQALVNTRVFELSCLLIVTVNRLDSFAGKEALLTFVVAGYMRDMASGTTDKRRTCFGAITSCFANSMREHAISSSKAKAWVQ
jgi:hypothetical protein